MLTFFEPLKMTPNITVIVAVTISPIFFTVLYKLKRFNIGAVICTMVIFLIAIFKFIEEIIQSLIILNANLLAGANEFLDMNWLYYKANYTIDEYTLSITVFNIGIAFFLSLVLGLIIVYLKRPFVVGLILIPFAFISIYFSETPLTIPLILMLCGFMAVYAMRCAVDIPSGSYDGNFLKSIHKNKIIYHLCSSRVKRKSILSITAITLSAVLLITSGVSLIVPQDKYVNTTNAENMFINIVDGITGISENGFSFGSGGGGVSGGKLGRIDEIIYENKLHLKVTTDLKAPMYLRAFIGSDYRDNRWSDFNQGSQERNIWLFEQFKSLKYSPQYLGSDFNQYMSDNYKTIQNNYGILDPPIKTANISVENIAANNKFIYTPYHLKSADYADNLYADTTIERGMFSPKKHKSEAYMYLNVKGGYGYTSHDGYSTAIRDWDINNYLNNFANDDLVQMEETYQLYVDKYYTTVTTQQLQVLKPAIEQINSLGVQSVKDKIDSTKLYLSSQTQYSLSPGKTPLDRDFVQYFLYENKKGYCVHYATAAVLLLRALGIPARYAEGYVVTMSDYANNTSTTEFTAEINDTNAHAWIEVYQPRLGWMPYEVTPGYNSSTVNLQNLGEENTSSEETTSSEEESSQPSSSPSSEEVSSEPVSSETSSQTQSDLSETNSELDKTPTDYTLLIIIGNVVLFIIFVALTFILRRHIIVSKRKKRVNTNSNRAMLEIYMHICETLKVEGFDINDYTDERSYAKAASKNRFKILGIEKFTEITELVLKARFSSHELSIDEMKQIREFYSDICMNIYKELKIVPKFVFKYIKVLL